jgi:three-Cys-motif partner protein
MSSERHVFGSLDTDTKLSCLQQYLTAYSTALKSKGFARVYIDAFAGTGSRTVTHASLPIFSEGEASTVEVTTAGSASIALEIEPGFHHIVLIEQDTAKIDGLNSLLSRHRNKPAWVRTGDANEIVQRVCRKYDWHKENMRGVIFLDPYGMEVSWETVKAIADTQALDCWYFFPLSGLYRNSPRDASRLDQGKIDNLNRVLGTDAWRTEWYETNPIQTEMFEQPVAEYRSVNVDQIEAWVQERLSSVFKGKVLKPLRLRHANGAPMASLFFAVSNPNPQAVKVASRIADHILKAGMLSQVR